MSNIINIGGGAGGSSGGGHTILDNSGTSLTQRAELQFKGAYSEDNSTDEVTEVNVVREMTKAEFDLLTNDEKVGIINVTDESGMALYVNGRQVSGGGGGDASKRELTWAEYQALTEAEKNNGTMYFCNDVNGDDSEFQPVIYSEEEREIGVWTDGKPLYEKTIFGTTEQSAPETQVNHGINNLDTVVSIEGSIRCGTQYQTLFEHSRPSNEEFTRISDTVVSIVSTDGDWRGKPFHITLRYTKTTDQAGSGTWTPQGVPAVHYSTTEHVVGTWIDGSTLYEKTINFGALPNRTTKSVPHGISNLGVVVSCFGVSSDSTNSLALSYVNGSSDRVGIYFDSTYANVVTSTDISAYTETYLTVQYTKAT